MNGKTAVEEDFINIDHLDSFCAYSLDAQLKAREWQPAAELWLGETASAYDAGAPGLSDAYIAGFM